MKSGRKPAGAKLVEGLSGSDFAKKRLQQILPDGYLQCPGELLPKVEHVAFLDAAMGLQDEESACI